MRFKPALLSAVALIALVPVPAFGTSIVGIWTPTRITIAADSKQTIMGPTGIYLGSTNACKIYQAHGLVFALAGLAAAEGVTVADQIKSSTLLHEQGNGRKLPLDTVLVAAQGSIVNVLKARNIASDPNIPVKLLVAGMIDGKLQMVRFELGGVAIQGVWSIPTSTRQFAYPQSRGYNGGNPNRGVEILGLADAAQRFQKILPGWNIGDDVTVATRLVAIEASDSAASQFVGPPISTIVIDKNGPKWIDKGVCDWTPAKPTK